MHAFAPVGPLSSLAARYHNDLYVDELVCQIAFLLHPSADDQTGTPQSCRLVPPFEFFGAAFCLATCAAWMRSPLNRAMIASCQFGRDPDARINCPGIIFDVGEVQLTNIS